MHPFQIHPPRKEETDGRPRSPLHHPSDAPREARPHLRGCAEATAGCSDSRAEWWQILVAFNQGDPSGGSIFPAVWNAMLSARADGVGSAITGVLLFKRDKFFEILNVPTDQGWNFACLVTMGYPTGVGGSRRADRYTKSRTETSGEASSVSRFRNRCGPHRGRRERAGQFATLGQPSWANRGANRGYSDRQIRPLVPRLERESDLAPGF